MIRPICRDTIILTRKSIPAGRSDISAADDLMDTLRANAVRCVGMAANMIGVNKRIIVFSVGPANAVMFNPVIVSCSEPYEAEESCLSLDGSRKTTRYQYIEVSYLDRDFKKRRQTFAGFPAQIIQHEIDHCDGILI